MSFVLPSLNQEEMRQVGAETPPLAFLDRRNDYNARHAMHGMTEKCVFIRVFFGILYRFFI